MPAIFSRTTRRVWRIFTILAALGFMGWPARAAEVSQQPPPICRETLAAWLTPLKEVLCMRARRTRTPNTSA